MDIEYIKFCNKNSLLVDYADDYEVKEKKDDQWVNIFPVFENLNKKIYLINELNCNGQVGVKILSEELKKEVHIICPEIFGKKTIKIEDFLVKEGEKNIVISINLKSNSTPEDFQIKVWAELENKQILPCEEARLINQIDNSSKIICYIKKNKSKIVGVYLA
jgi:hypothetical protein